MAKKRVLSGIRASGRLHLGNYLGAIKGMLELQDNPEYETFYMVADMHALTTPHSVEELEKNRMQVVLDYLAAGLDPAKSVIFEQSDSLSGELSFYFSSVVTVARMQHLPTYKEKITQYPTHATMALLNYPVLMAADILAYRAHEVPVGDDQLPHLEVAREIARKMNEQYGMDFPEPIQFKTQGHYVPSLTGQGKMSKSVAGSYIALADDLDTIKKHLAGVPTDSGKGDSVPGSGGVANLLELVGLFEGAEKKKHFEGLYTSSGIRYSELKEELAKAIFETLQPIQEKRRELESKPEYIREAILEGGARAKSICRQTLNQVREHMGLFTK
jgi:tryptophanyl-tRNA synthetase